jgi:hypothetical protein
MNKAKAHVLIAQNYALKKELTGVTWCRKALFYLHPQDKVHEVLNTVDTCLKLCVDKYNPYTEQKLLRFSDG